MKYIITLCAACAVIAAAAITTTPMVPGFFDRDITPLETERMDARAQARSLHRQHREYMLADSLVQLLPDTPGITVGVTRLTRDTPDTVSALARENLHGIDTLRARIGLFVVDDSYGLYPAQQTEASTDLINLFTGTDAGGPYCIASVTKRGTDTRSGSVLLDSWRRQDSTRMRYVRDPLAGCRFWAAYGAPGAAIDAWLQSGGYVFASARVGELAGRDTTSRRALFGRPNYFVQDARAEACLSNNDNACVQAILDPYWKPDTTGAAAFHARSFGWEHVFGRGEEALLASLEAEFGPDRFAQFWSSTLPVPDAFEAAFGVSLESWLHRWTDTWYNRYEAGPRMAGSTWLMTLALIAALLGASWALARRRQVA